MAEKIVYEVGLEGASAVVGGINAIQNAISNVSGEGLMQINEDFAKAIEGADRLNESISKLAKTIKNVNGSFTIGAGGSRNKSNWMGSVSDALGKWNQSWEKKFKTRIVEDVDEEGNVHRRREYVPGFGSPSNFITDFARAANRVSGDWGTIRQRARSMLAKSFGYMPLLGWDTGAGFTTGEIGATSMKDNIAARDSIAKIHREYFRDLKSKFYAPTVWQGGAPAVVNPTGTALATLNDKYGIVDTGRVTDPGYVDAEWSYAGAGSMSGARATALPGGNMIPPASRLSRLMGFLGKLNMYATAISAAIRGVKFFSDMIRKAGRAVISFAEKLSEASWRRLRESYAYGMSVSSLARHERAISGIGGDAASASALLSRWSRERSMLAFGGNGGSMMEAARLFGIGITGSGEHGFATNDEFMRNVISVMSKATPETRNAIANTLGLTPYQTWAFSHGQQYYDNISRKSLADTMMGDRLAEWDKILTGENAERFRRSWGQFKESMVELGDTLANIVLPILTTFIDLLEGFSEILNVILKPLSWIMSASNNFFSARWWQDMLSATPTKEENAMQMQAITNNGQSMIINVGDVKLSSLPPGVSSSDAASRFANEIFNKLGELTINNRR